MEILSFTQENGKHITHFDSDFIMSQVTKTIGEAHIGIVYLRPGQIIGFHHAIVPQILLVIEGEGWVSGGDQIKQKLIKGQAVKWEKGEGHETSSESGMVAIIIEAEELIIKRTN